MALKPTIYKWKIDLCDLDRNHYDALALTVAQHPSETLERMVVRVLAFCIDASDGLEFTRGLSEAEEPDLWRRAPDDRIELWIEVGEPSADRLKKASRRADRVKVYSFNTKSGIWWSQGRAALAGLGLQVYQLDWSEVSALAAQLDRTVAAALTISEQSAFFSLDGGDFTLSWQPLD